MPAGGESKIREAIDIALKYQGQGRLRAAGDIYRRVLRVEPENPDALHFLGVIAHKVGRPDLALELLVRSIAADPDRVGFRMNLGSLYLKHQKVEEAIACYRAAIALEPASASAHAHLAAALARQGRLEEANDAYARATELKPLPHAVPARAGSAEPTFEHPIKPNVPTPASPQPVGQDESQLAETVAVDDVSGEPVVEPTPAADDLKVQEVDAAHWGPSPEPPALLHEPLPTDECVLADEPLAVAEPLGVDERLAVAEPPLVAEPLAADEPFTVDEHLAVDESFAVSEPLAADEPFTVDEPLAVDESFPVSEPLAADEPLLVDDPLPVSEPILVDAPLAVDEPLLVDDPLPVSEPILVDAPLAVDEPLPADESLAVSESVPVDEPVLADVPPSTAEPIVEPASIFEIECMEHPALPFTEQESASIEFVVPVELDATCIELATVSPADEAVAGPIEFVIPVAPTEFGLPGRVESADHTVKAALALQYAWALHFDPAHSISFPAEAAFSGDDEESPLDQELFAIPRDGLAEKSEDTADGPFAGLEPATVPPDADSARDANLGEISHGQSEPASEETIAAAPAVDAGSGGLESVGGTDDLATVYESVSPIVLEETPEVESPNSPLDFPGVADPMMPTLISGTLESTFVMGPSADADDELVELHLLRPDEWSEDLLPLPEPDPVDSAQPDEAVNTAIEDAVDGGPVLEATAVMPFPAAAFDGVADIDLVPPHDLAESLEQGPGPADFIDAQTEPQASGPFEEPGESFELDDDTPFMESMTPMNLLVEPAERPEAESPEQATPFDKLRTAPVDPVQAGSSLEEPPNEPVPDILSDSPVAELESSEQPAPLNLAQVDPDLEEDAIASAPEVSIDSSPAELQSAEQPPIDVAQVCDLAPAADAGASPEIEAAVAALAVPVDIDEPAVAGSSVLLTTGCSTLLTTGWTADPLPAGVIMSEPVAAVIAVAAAIDAGAVSNDAPLIDCTTVAGAPLEAVEAHVRPGLLGEAHAQVLAGRFDPGGEAAVAVPAVDRSAETLPLPGLPGLRSFRRPIPPIAPAGRGRPPSAESLRRRGVALLSFRKLDEAVHLFNRAIALRPRFAEAHRDLGGAMLRQGNLEGAITSLRRALKLRPGFAEAWGSLGDAYQLEGKIGQAIRCYRRLLELVPRAAKVHSNMLLSMNYDPHFSAEEIFHEHLRWAERHAERHFRDIQPHANDRTPGRQLKIGYVSPDFRRHSVNYFAEPVLAGHYRRDFHVTCYSDVIRPDGVTRGLADLSDHFRDTHLMNDEQLAARIRDDEIDILVDLSGHTGNNRLGTFARKPAPVQVTYLGYPNTTGLSTIDYRITDALADPPGQTERLHSEQLVRLPETFLCYQPPETSPEVGPLPSLKAGYVTFGCFNILAKITDEVMALWARVLQELPNSRLVLKGRSSALSVESRRKHVRDIFVNHGIAPDRLELLGKEPSYDQHLLHYRRLDVVLDPFPYNGTTTTCEALWMGLPVVTLAGNRHVSRVGVSILTNIGLPELIAATPEQYVRIATSLADSPQKMSRLRSTLRDRMMRSPLTDSIRLTRALEAEYRSMWVRWCQSEHGSPTPPAPRDTLTLTDG